MSDKKVPLILPSQMEDALEERDRERRKAAEGTPPDVKADRRKQDRRAAKSKNKE